MASIQFRNKESLLSYYESLGIDTWAIYFEKDKCFSRGASLEDLEKSLSILEDGASNSIYTLRVYNDKSPEKISPKDIASYSINFRLNGDNMQEPQSSKGVTRSQQYSAIGKVHQMLEEKIAKKMFAMMDGESEREEPENKLGIIGEILEHPVIGNIVEKVALNWLSGQTAGLNAGTVQMPVMEPMRAVGNIATDKELVEAIEALKKVDPKLTEHLKKLALLAQTDAAMFAMITNSLDKM